MLWSIFVMFCKAAFDAVRERVASAPKSKSESLCADCYFAHLQYAANGRMAISCTYGGAVRPLKLDVLYCTDYRARNMPLRVGMIGFVCEIAPTESAGRESKLMLYSAGHILDRTALV